MIYIGNMKIIVKTKIEPFIIFSWASVFDELCFRLRG